MLQAKSPFATMFDYLEVSMDWGILTGESRGEE